MKRKKKKKKPFVWLSMLWYGDCLENKMFDENDLDALDEDTLRVSSYVTDCFYGGEY